MIDQFLGAVGLSRCAVERQAIEDQLKGLKERQGVLPQAVLALAVQWAAVGRLHGLSPAAILHITAAAVTVGFRAVPGHLSPLCSALNGPLSTLTTPAEAGTAVASWASGINLPSGLPLRDQRVWIGLRYVAPFLSALIPD